MILGITTFRRLKYLNTLLESFSDTADRSHDWRVIIHNDETRKLDIRHKLFCPMEIIYSKEKGVHVGTNRIIHSAMKRDFDFAFKADDDIFFLRPEWDNHYYKYSREGNFHLSFNNKLFRPPVKHSQGHFWTFTKQVIEKVGYFDCASFGHRGIGHIDFSMRCCRAGFNSASAFVDAPNSRQYIGTYSPQEYFPALPESVVIEERRTHPAKLRIANDESRLYIPYNL